MNKFTDGTWRLNERNDIEMNCEIICSIADISPDDATYEEAIANAHLIAAAPELLEALETLADVCPCQNGCAPDDMTCATNKAKAAITKARGES